jgi:hypothetical protein
VRDDELHLSRSSVVARLLLHLFPSSPGRIKSHHAFDCSSIVILRNLAACSVSLFADGAVPFPIDLFWFLSRAISAHLTCVLQEFLQVQSRFSTDLLLISVASFCYGVETFQNGSSLA